MATQKRLARGVGNIRTRTGGIRQAMVPHKMYLRLSCLEMERARHAEEKKGALARIRTIDERFEKIDTEKAALLAAMAGTGMAVPVERAKIVPEAEPVERRPGVRLRY